MYITLPEKIWFIHLLAETAEMAETWETMEATIWRNGCFRRFRRFRRLDLAVFNIRF